MSHLDSHAFNKVLLCWTTLLDHLHIIRNCLMPFLSSNMADSAIIVEFVTITYLACAMHVSLVLSKTKNVAEVTHAVLSKKLYIFSLIYALIVISCQGGLRVGWKIVLVIILDVNIRCHVKVFSCILVNNCCLVFNCLCVLERVKVSHLWRSNQSTNSV